mgnify:CR=1 FL=1
MDIVKGPDNRLEERIGQMIQTYEKDLLRLCCMYLKDRTMAEDAVQETFVKAYRNLKSFRGESNEKTWLVRIAINVCKDMQRTAWFQNLGRMVNLDDVKLPPDTEVRSEVVEQIMSLPKKLKEVVLLFYYENMNQSEIAEALGVSVTTVHRRLNKAREALRLLLQGGNELHV